jgi:hypothetical protein
VLHTVQYALVPGDLLLLVVLSWLLFQFFDHRIYIKIILGSLPLSSLSACIFLEVLFQVLQQLGSSLAPSLLVYN